MRIRLSRYSLLVKFVARIKNILVNNEPKKLWRHSYDEVSLSHIRIYTPKLQEFDLLLK